MIAKCLVVRRAFFVEVCYTKKMKVKQKAKKPIIYAFVDSQNLNLGVRSQGWKLGFVRFRKYLEDKYGVSKAFLFIGYVLLKNKLEK